MGGKKAATTNAMSELFSTADEQRLLVIAGSSNRRRQLARLVKSGLAVSPWRGMYALPETWERLRPDERTRRIVRTLSHEHPDWIFTSLTAALMHNLFVSFQDLTPLRLLVPPDCKTKSTSSILRCPSSETETVVVDGVPVTTLERTVLDSLIELDFRRGLAIADSALAASGFSKHHFLSYFKTRQDVTGWQFALDAMAWADPRSANGGESVARAVMIEQGFQVPELQVRIPNIIEGGNYYGDYYWTLPDGSIVVGELDGIDKYVEPEMTHGRSIAKVMADERRRESRIGLQGMRVVRFSFGEVEKPGFLMRLLDSCGIPRGPIRPRGRVQ